MNKKWKVLVVDDHKMVREGISMMLDSTTGYRVVGEACDGMEAVEQFKLKRPDIVIMDVAMPRLNGIDAAAQIKAVKPDARIIFLTMHQDDVTINRALKLGVAGYILKSCAFQQLVEAVEAAVKNNSYLSPEISKKMMHFFQNPKSAEKSPLAALTMKERHIMQLIAEGNSSKDIANLLHVSFNTVKTHRNNLMDKLNIRSVAELTRYAISHKLVIYDLQ